MRHVVVNWICSAARTCLAWCGGVATAARCACGRFADNLGRAFSAFEVSTQSGRELLAGLSHYLCIPLARLRRRAETECSDLGWQLMEPDFLAVGRFIDQFQTYLQGQSGVTIGAMHSLSDLVQEVVKQYQADGAPVALLSLDSDGPVVPAMGV